ncbi:MAG: hypothetical protein CMF38_05585 [Legionellaceae bacterium]|nr:hypothetical protein [Legionellaceae bacterium]HCA88886.1 hypothetical protein [Legionellales bacterium]|tara:strand:+ start:528 stop:1613 length:1086 start_codon:yes stop_codon:yes gene_type:complete
MKICLLLMFNLALSHICWAKTPYDYHDYVDVYGAPPAIAQQIIAQYGQQIDQLGKEVIAISKNKSTDEEKFNHYIQNKLNLLATIKKKYGFLYADINTSIFNDPDKIFNTLDVVQKKDKNRMKFVHKRPVPRAQPMRTTRSFDVVDKMTEHKELVLEAMFTGDKAMLKKSNCPVYHCLSNFEHPKLKPYLAIFNQAAVQHKNLIKHTIQQDDDPVRREAAVLLTSHMTKPHDIIKLVMPAVYDENEETRNSAMLVIADTMKKAKYYDVNLKPFIDYLDSSSTSDRNKALYVLSIAAESDKNKAILAQRAKSQLIKLLKLKQPDNHNFAYTVLKKISHQSIGEHDFAAWQQWHYQPHTKSKA